MIKYLNIYMILLLIVGMSSCNQEVITMDDPDTMLDPPVEVDYPVAKGVLTDSTGVLADAKVAVYQQGELKGETTTNSLGEFNTLEIETEIGFDMLLEFSKEKYFPRYRKRSESFLSSNTLDVELNTNPTGIPTTQIIQGVTDYISISGNVMDVGGGAGSAKIRAEMLSTYYDQNGGQGTLNVLYDETTDSDGYYELIIPKESIDLRVAVYNDFECTDYYTEPVTPIVGGYLGELMGPFSQDFVLPTYTSIVRPSHPILSVWGFVSDCDAEDLVLPPTIEFRLTDKYGEESYFEVSTEDERNFVMHYFECIAIPYTVQVVAIDIVNNMHSDTLTFEVVDGFHIERFVHLLTCNAAIGDFSTAVMSSGGNDYIFDQLEVRMENGNLISDNSSASYANFTMPNIQMGNSDIVGLDLGSWALGVGFKAVNNVMTANVISLTSTSATVVVTGDFVSSGVTVQGTCTLNLIF